MRIKIILAGLLLANTCTAQLADSLQAHIDTALNLMRQHSLYADRVDWSHAAAEADSLARQATRKEQLFPAIASVFRRIGDHHGLFAQYNDIIRLTDSQQVNRLSQRIKDEWAKGWQIKTAWLGNVAYLRVPGMHVNDAERIAQYANRLADSIHVLAKARPAAWIIDLRMNSGGNILPMMSALAGFFNNGVLSYSLDRVGNIAGWSSIQNGVFYQEDTLRTQLREPVADLSRAKVAVLVGAGTGSSGEITAIHFQQRKKTRLFGERTGGVTNATEGFLFNNNNSYFLLTTSSIADRKKKRLPDYVEPQQFVQNNDHFTDLYQDTAVQAALRWLKLG